MKQLMLLAAMGLLLSGCAASAQTMATVPSSSVSTSSEDAVSESVNAVSDSSGNAGEALAEAKESALFQKGNGGDQAWWEAHQKDACNADEKTAAAFALAVLKRDIGAVSGQPAGIDALIEPSKLADLKKQLAIYDISSPSVREIHFTELAKDQTGILYTFRVTGGTSADQFQGFEGTLQIHVNGTSHLVDAIPTATFDAKPATKK